MISLFSSNYISDIIHILFLCPWRHSLCIGGVPPGIMVRLARECPQASAGVKGLHIDIFIDSRPAPTKLYTHSENVFT